MKSIKDIIRGLREDKDLKQKHIAEILGINQQYYSKYETGEYEIPTRHIVSISKFYNVSCDYILGLIDSKLPIGGNLYEKELELIKKENIIKKFNKLNHNQKVKVAEYINLIECQINNKKRQKTSKEWD